MAQEKRTPDTYRARECARLKEERDLLLEAAGKARREARCLGGQVDEKTMGAALDTIHETLDKAIALAEGGKDGAE